MLEFIFNYWYICVIAVAVLLIAIYARIAYKDIQAQKEDDELHFDPWEDDHR